MGLEEIMIARRSFIAALAATPIVTACSRGAAAAAEGMKKVPAPAVDAGRGGAGLKKAVLAGGCFWGVQAVFAHTQGVTRSVSGYAGGTKETAQYDAVSTGRTRHAEAVEVTYDPAKITFGQLLQIFFSVATDPTQLDMQFPDVGPQYRNEIFFVGEEQQRVAKAYIAQLDAARVYPKKIVTKLSPLAAFYPAEKYHQDYLFENPKQPYIVMYDQPKIRALKALFPSHFRDKPVRYNQA
jgi:peptide-methionine (S)-S-oxide reductase